MIFSIMRHIKPITNLRKKRLKRGISGLEFIQTRKPVRVIRKRFETKQMASSVKLAITI